MTDHTYLVQFAANIEVSAPDAQEARDMALAELAHRCEAARGIIIRVEEVT